MARSIWQKTITNENGDIQDGVQITVNVQGGGLATIYENQSGGTAKANPFLTGADGVAKFFAEPGFYEVTAFKNGETATFEWNNLGDNDIREELASTSGGGFVRLNDGKTLQEYADQFSTASLDAAVQSATADADRAETAADAAMTAGWVYPDVASGEAARVDGNYFWVVSSSDNEVLELWLMGATTATDTGKRIISSGYVKDRIFNEPFPNYDYLIIDEDGKIAFAIKKDGTAVSPSIETDIINGVFANDILPDEQKPIGFTSEINGIASYGQSLSLGATATPAISTTQPYDSIMFNSGVRTQDGGTDPVVIYDSFVPMIEQSGDGGETPVSGTAQSIKELIASENGISYTQQNYQLLGYAPGQNGTGINGLSKGSSPYTRLLENIKYSVIECTQQSKAFAFQAMTWMQGEANYSGGTEKLVYENLLSQLVDDFKSDTVAITNQSFSPVVISYQIGSHLRYAKSAGVASAFKAEIAQAQLELSTKRSDFIVAMPMYQFDYTGSVDQVHLTATDSKVAGGYFGIAYKRAIIDGEKFIPLKPTGINRSGKAIYLNFNVPKPPLVIDTTWVSENTGYGFRVFDKNGTQIDITSVEVINGENIKITTATDVGNSPITVDYALFTNDATGETGRAVGARGNIRDSQGDTIVFDSGGINRPMHNWLVMFTLKEDEKSWL